MIEPTIHTTRSDSLVDFLHLHHFEVEVLSEEVLEVTRTDELPVYVRLTETALYFEVDLGSVKELGSEALYRDLLCANADILPVSFGINQANPDDPRLVLLESRIHGDLSDQELLSVFDALELAVDSATKLLQSYIS
jgi:hypothetical protein